MPPQNNINYVFLGSATASIYVLDELKKAGLLPVLLITTPDKPVGRGLTLTPTGVKKWGQTHDIPVLDPVSLNTEAIALIRKSLEGKLGADPFHDSTEVLPVVFIVAAYGKIIPQALLDIPKYGTLNIHPSLLPKYRGASPLQSTILADAKETGVTIMSIDADMDHGPILIQEKVTINEWPMYEAYEEMMFRRGGRTLAGILPDWIAGNIKPREQDHAAATFTKKIVKEDGLVEFTDIVSGSTETQYMIFRKIQAFHEWPQVYFFIPRPTTTDIAANTPRTRVKITKASWSDNKLAIEKVIPEGKKETDYATFLKNFGL